MSSANKTASKLPVFAKAVITRMEKKLSKKESKANPDSYTLTHLENIID